jgi:hypothetical protein
MPWTFEIPFMVPLKEGRPRDTFCVRSMATQLDRYCGEISMNPVRCNRCLYIYIYINYQNVHTVLSTYTFGILPLKQADPAVQNYIGFSMCSSLKRRHPPCGLQQKLLDENLCVYASKYGGIGFDLQPFSSMLKTVLRRWARLLLRSLVPFPWFLGTLPILTCLSVFFWQETLEVKW